MEQNYLNWRQTDPRFNRSEAWPSALFPQADFHFFRDCGCLVCALAVMLRRHGIEKEEDEALFDPWILNQRLIAAGAFSDAADLELSAVQELYPLVCLGAVPYSGEALAQKQNTAKSTLPRRIVPSRREVLFMILFGVGLFGLLNEQPELLSVIYRFDSLCLLKLSG